MPKCEGKLILVPSIINLKSTQNNDFYCPLLNLDKLSSHIWATATEKCVQLLYKAISLWTIGNYREKKWTF